MATIRAVATRAARAAYSAPIASSSRTFATSPSSFNTSEVEHTPATPQNEQRLTVKDFGNPQFPNPVPLRRTHGIHVATLILYAHYPRDLEVYSQFAWLSSQSLGIPATRPAPLPKRQELVTVLKSPFVHKKNQENFERRHLRRAIEVFDTNMEQVDLWLRYLKKNSIGGIGMRATIHRFVDVGFGAEETGVDAQGSKPSRHEAQENIAEVAERLLKELSEPEAAEETPAVETPKKEASTKSKITEAESAKAA